MFGDGTGRTCGELKLTKTQRKQLIRSEELIKRDDGGVYGCFSARVFQPDSFPTSSPTNAPRFPSHVVLKFNNLNFFIRLLLHKKKPLSKVTEGNVPVVHSLFTLSCLQRARVVLGELLISFILIQSVFQQHR